MSRRRFMKKTLFQRVSDWIQAVLEKIKRRNTHLLPAFPRRRISRSSLHHRRGNLFHSLSMHQRKILFYSASGIVTVGIIVAFVFIFAGGDKKTASVNSDYAQATISDLMQSPSPTIDPTPTPLPSPTPDPTLTKGMENEDVASLQSRLMDLGYLDLDEPTQYYGSATKFAVQLFQRQNGLQQDGIAGPETLQMIFSQDAKKYMLLEGMSGTDVTSFQKRLIELGYMKKATGTYGDDTIQAVKDFQKRNGLAADGKAGEDTFNLIFSPDAKPSANKAAEVRRSASITKMVQIAAKQLGKKYVLGHEGPSTFDCSGLVYYCLKQAGSNRGRFNAAGYSKVSDWEKITSMSNLKKGDLIFFYNNAFSKVGHVAIYIGGGMMIDASSSNGKVVKRTCTSAYWKKHFVCGRRPW